ncbi:hypothetical protein LY78DRAFT_657552 [Colletotrichum sublineola]|nr:hypothetical protein LY78DRAFT_657552 [Colletotrichum sublineola]
MLPLMLVVLPCPALFASPAVVAVSPTFAALRRPTDGEIVSPALPTVGWIGHKATCREVVQRSAAQRSAGR